MSLMRPPVTATSAGRPGRARAVDHGPPTNHDVSAHGDPSSQPGPPSSHATGVHPKLRRAWRQVRWHRDRCCLPVGRTTCRSGAGLECRAWRFGGSGRRRSAPSDDALQISGAIVAPSDGPSPVELVDAGHAPHGLGIVRDQYVRKIRKTPDHPHGAELHHGGGSPPALRRVRQRRRARARRSGDATDLGRQHPRLLRRRWHVLAGERPAGRAARLAGHQPQPARVRRQRSARLAGRLHGEPGQPGHGHRAQGRRRTRRPAGPLHGRRRRRPVRPRPPTAHPRADLPRRRQHTRLEGPQRHHPDPALAGPARCRAHGRHDQPPSSSTCPTCPSDASTRRCAPSCPTCARTSAPWARRCRSAACSCRSTSAVEVRALAAQQIPILNEWGCFDRITPGHTALEFAAIARSPVHVGTRRSQLDAGPTPGPSRHPHPPALGPGRSWARWRTAGVSSPLARSRCAPSTERRRAAVPSSPGRRFERP